MDSSSKLRHFVYLIKNKINNKIYVGVHSCNCNFLDTKYYGSGKALRRSIKKYKLSNFERFVIDECDTRSEADSLESIIVDETFLKRDDVYNLVPGGIKGGTYVRLVEIRSVDEFGNVECFPSFAEATRVTGCDVRCGRGEIVGDRRWFRPGFEIPEIYLRYGYKPPKYKSKDKNNNIEYFYSLREAETKTGITKANIANCFSVNMSRYAGDRLWAKMNDEFKPWPMTVHGRKRVEVLYPDGSTKMFDGVNIAADILDMDAGNISSCCNGSRKTHHGLKFRFWSDDGPV